MFDVIAVDIKTLKIRIIANNKTERDADAIERMAVMRRGVDDEFFVVSRHGLYSDGDVYVACEKS